jgi:hypothetical protein
MKIIRVKSCSECPFHNCDDASHCMVKGFGDTRDYIDDNVIIQDKLDDECPLRREEIVVLLENENALSE